MAMARIDQEGHIASGQRSRDVAAGANLQHRIQNCRVGRLRLEPGQRFGARRERSSDPVRAVLQPFLEVEGIRASSSRTRMRGLLVECLLTAFQIERNLERGLNGKDRVLSVKRKTRRGARTADQTAAGILGSRVTPRTHEPFQGPGCRRRSRVSHFVN